MCVCVCIISTQVYICVYFCRLCRKLSEVFCSVCVCVCAHSCLYLFVVESLKAYPAAGKLPKATWHGEKAVGGSEER